MEWPLHNDKTGKPRTTPTNQAIWRAAVQPARAEQPGAVAAWEALLDQTASTWRQDYVKVVEAFVQLQAAATPETAVAMSRAGLEYAEKEAFVFRFPDETNDDNAETTVVPVNQAFDMEAQAHRWKNQKPLQAATYTGGKKSPQSSSTSSSFALASPHGSDKDPLWLVDNDDDGNNTNRKAAVAQLKAWADYGCMEPSARQHAEAVLTNTDPSSNYVKGKIFCLLGVTSEMGPAKHLLKLPGAHVLGVARAGKRTQALLEWFEEYGSSSATLTLIDGGADLLQQGPQIAQWIVQTIQGVQKYYQDQSLPPVQQVVVMPLAYMDGEANCRCTVAMDGIVQHVTKQLHNNNHCQVALAYLTSPTTCYTIPPEAALDAKKRWQTQNSGSMVVTQLVRMASLGQWMELSEIWERIVVENDDSSKSAPYALYNGLISLQGPNYALAKTMQQWRCMVAAFGSDKMIVAAPMAPPTRTASVVHSAEAQAGSEGIQYFAPNVFFDVQPCSSLMTAIVLHQVSRKKQQQHPLELFWDGAVHGGGWRCPYYLSTCFAASFLLGKTIAKNGWCPPEALGPLPESLQQQQQQSSRGRRGGGMPSVVMSILLLHLAAHAPTTESLQQHDGMSRRTFLLQNAAIASGASVLATRPSLAAEAAPPTIDTSYFGKNLQPATQERPAIPLPTLTQQQQMERPAVEGVVYAPSNLNMLDLSSAALLVEIRMGQQQQQLLQTAKIPLTKISSFPFRFQFTKFKNPIAIPEDQDLIVSAQIVLGTDDSTRPVCSLLEGRGVAKALQLPGVNDSVIFVRSAASVKLQATTTKC